MHFDLELTTSFNSFQLGPNGVEEWIPNHKMNNLNQRCRPGQSSAAVNRTGTTSSGRDITGGAQRSSGDSFASQGSLGGVVSYVNSNGRDSCADQVETMITIYGKFNVIAISA